MTLRWALVVPLVLAPLGNGCARSSARAGDSTTVVALDSADVKGPANVTPPAAEPVASTKEAPGSNQPTRESSCRNASPRFSAHRNTLRDRADGKGDRRWTRVGPDDIARDRRCEASDSDRATRARVASAQQCDGVGGRRAGVFTTGGVHRDPLRDHLDRRREPARRHAARPSRRSVARHGARHGEAHGRARGSDRANGEQGLDRRPAYRCRSRGPDLSGSSASVRSRRVRQPTFAARGPGSFDSSASVASLGAATAPLPFPFSDEGAGARRLTSVRIV